MKTAPKMKTTPEISVPPIPPYRYRDQTEHSYRYQYQADDSCGKVVEEKIMRTSIKFEDLDYLEGARLIALNRSATYCREHILSRVLPVRRCRTGSRPSV